MDWWLRLVAPNKQTNCNANNDPEYRFAKFKRNYDTVLTLCNQPRDLTSEGPLLERLQGCLERITVIIRDESRAAAPHLSIQAAAKTGFYAVISRAATISQHEPTILATVSVLAALVDSEEEDFMVSSQFAKSTMRMATRVLDSDLSLSTEVETLILELLFTIAAKIRLQTDILPNWFHSTAKPELEDVFVSEKQAFVGTTAKADFPLCYLLTDKVHHEGRAGDFARTGLLYIFEATGRSPELEQWIVSSDLPTLLASGLGALYSQLSRELSILHPDATLPAVLAMSDYTTTHWKAMAESAFSDDHKQHMSAFLLYLTFWQDVLDHCKSLDVKQTLLDHFQILFLQQILYPSLLRSSDNDAGSSVAVLTYMAAMLEALAYPDLISMMLEYLLAMQSSWYFDIGSEPTPLDPPRSPTALRRKENLLHVAAAENPDESVEPTLFSLVDLILNNIGSQNSQSAFAALKLASTILTRHRRFSLGTLLRTEGPGSKMTGRTVGALELETDKYAELINELGHYQGLAEAFTSSVHDAWISIEAQAPAGPVSSHSFGDDDRSFTGRYNLSPIDPLLKTLRTTLRLFLSNGVDVNLALSQTIIAVALYTELRLDSWLGVNPAHYRFDDGVHSRDRLWYVHLYKDDHDTLSKMQEVSQRPIWSLEQAPLIYQTLQALVEEIGMLRITIPNLDHLISARRSMLQSVGLDADLLSEAPLSQSVDRVPAGLEDGFVAAADEQSSIPMRTSSLANAHKKIDNVDDVQAIELEASPDTQATSNVVDRAASQVKSLYMPPPVPAPSATDVIRQRIELPSVGGNGQEDETAVKRNASLNHILTNIVILQDFLVEIIAVMQVRAAVLGDGELRVL